MLPSCSIPNLEAPECDRARDRVREFYSLHFGNDLVFGPDEVLKRQQYLTPGFFEALHDSLPTTNPFTLTNDPPKAFRVGECQVIEPDRRVAFELILFWKTDTRSEEQIRRVETEIHDGTWRIAAVNNLESK